MMSQLLYLSIFTSALVSGWHCAMMCGGVASFAESKVVRLVSPRRMWAEQFVMHLSRVAMYMILGGFAGEVGALIWRQEALPIQRGMFFVASIFLILQAYFLTFGAKRGAGGQSLLGFGSLFQSLENWVGRAWTKLSGRFSILAQHGNWAFRIGMGLLWGLIPCSLVYSVLPLAFLSGSFSSGALLMGAMGLGTLPNLLIISGLVGKVVAHLAQAGRERWMRWIAGGLMLMAGLIGIYYAFTLPEAFLKGGFCLS